MPGTRTCYRALLTAALLLLESTTAMAAEAGDLLVRLRGIGVLPDDSSGAVSTLPGSGVDVDDAYTLELDFTYMLSSRLGLELILATSEHDVDGSGSIDGLGKIAETRTLPPTLTLQYHFLPQSPVRPYAGVGINYTLFFDDDAEDSLNQALGDTSVDLDDSFGPALQAGLDVDLNDDWFLNFDLKYIGIDTDATLWSDGVRRSVDVDIDPFVVGIGIGRTF